MSFGTAALSPYQTLMSIRQCFYYYVLIVFSTFHHAATHNPGHGTKFVTLPSSLLCYEFHIFMEIGSICHCNHYWMWLVLLLLCGHK